MITLLASSRRDGSGVSARSDWYLNAMQHLSEGRIEDTLALGLIGIMFAVVVAVLLKCAFDAVIAVRNRLKK